MDLVTIDYETYYDDTYSLSKLTTEEYIRDTRFEPILLSIRINENEPYWVPQPDIQPALLDLHLERRAALAHHAHFDGGILWHHYGVRPKLWFDTLSMARALHGANGRLSLDKLAERYGIGRKGTEVLQAKGMHYRDFTLPQLARYGLYSCLDGTLCYRLFERMAPQFSRTELEIIDQVTRMFTEPVLVLDEAMLVAYAKQLHAEKMALMLAAGVQKDDLMSNEKFARALMDLGVVPPMKFSPSWLKKPPGERDPAKAYAYAFAKTDSGMQALQEHPDPRVQVLVEARLKNKTTNAERGAERLIGMGSRGAATVYYKYSGASGTHRLSGGDKYNWQAMGRGSTIRRALKAPEGHVIVVGDSANIEARLLDWLAGQDDMVEVYRKSDAGLGPDMYCVIGGRIYQRTITKENDPDERQMGKRVKLGLGFGMAEDRFILSVRGEAKGRDGKPIVLDHAFATYVVQTVYRGSHPQVLKLWGRGKDALFAISRGRIGVAVDFRGIVRTCEDGLVMPGGLKILYPDLKRVRNEVTGAEEWQFWNGKAREHIYGAKVIENIIQCLARIIVFEQCLTTAREARGIAQWKLSSHDEGGFVTHAFEAPWLRDRLLANMRVAPAWAPDLPLNSEGGYHQRYGLAKT
jgi:DNA polymerase